MKEAGYEFPEQTPSDDTKAGLESLIYPANENRHECLRRDQPEIGRSIWVPHQMRRNPLSTRIL